MSYKSYTYTDREWTTEPPTEEGWYWVKDGDTARIAEVFFASKTTLLADLTDEEMPRVLSAFTHWLGPLPVPESPT